MKSIITLAEEIVNLLAKYGASLSYAPDFTTEQIKERKVLIVPAGEKKEISSRKANAYDYIFSIGVLQKIKKKTEVPELVRLVEEISSVLLRSDFSGYCCTSVEFNPLFSVEELRGRSQFCGVINCTFTAVS